MHPYLKPSVVEPTIEEKRQYFNDAHQEIMERLQDIKKNFNKASLLIDGIYDSRDHNSDYSTRIRETETEKAFLKDLLYLKEELYREMVLLNQKENDVMIQIDNLEEEKDESSN